MTGMSEPEDQVIADRDGEASTQGSGRMSRSALGLSIISGLNVICLAFVIIHFASHPENPVAKAAEPSANSVFGNIDFAPMSALTISVASGIEEAGDGISGQQAIDATSPVTTPRSAAQAYPNEEQSPQSWVQLAALSNMNTATRVWSDLKKRHATLLSDRKPHYFGPDDVGGSLYHVRIGPMDTDAATGLCDELEAAGADCFCIRPKPKGMS